MTVLEFSLIWVNSGALAKRDEVRKHASDTSFYGYKWLRFMKKFFADTGISDFSSCVEDDVALRFITLMRLCIHPNMSFIASAHYKAVIPPCDVAQSARQACVVAFIGSWSLQKRIVSPACSASCAPKMAA